MGIDFQQGKGMHEEKAEKRKKKKEFYTNLFFLWMVT